MSRDPAESCHTCAIRSSNPSAQNSLSRTLPIPTIKRQINPAADEIWMTTREWVSEDDYEIGFERIFVRSA